MLELENKERCCIILIGENGAEKMLFNAEKSLIRLSEVQDANGHNSQAASCSLLRNLAFSQKPQSSLGAKHYCKRGFRTFLR